MATHDHAKDTQAVSHLNALLRTELSAVESYRHVLATHAEGDARVTLEQGCRTHERHVERISELVRRHGGVAADASGAWGSFVKVIEAGAALLGVKAVLTALEEAEEHSLREYKATLPKLDLESREVIESELLRDLERARDTIRALRASLT